MGLGDFGCVKIKFTLFPPPPRLFSILMLSSHWQSIVYSSPPPPPTHPLSILLATFGSPSLTSENHVIPFKSLDNPFSPQVQNNDQYLLTKFLALAL